MFNWLDEEKFKRLTMWSIYTLLFCQAFPLFYFNYTLDNPITRNFWTVGLLCPTIVSLIGILKPELVTKSLSNREESVTKKEHRGRLIAGVTFLLFTGAILYLWLF